MKSVSHVRLCCHRCLLAAIRATHSDPALLHQRLSTQSLFFFPSSLLILLPQLISLQFPPRRFFFFFTVQLKSRVKKTSQYSHVKRHACYCVLSLSSSTSSAVADGSAAVKISGRALGAHLLRVGVSEMKCVAKPANSVKQESI